VVPGHGPIANRDDLVNFHDTLRTIEGRIQRLVAAGSSVAEILAAAPPLSSTRSGDADMLVELSSCA